MALIKVKRLNNWYSVLGRLLILIGLATIFLWSVRLTIFKPMQFIIAVDDILGLLAFFILLIPNGFWFKYIGAHFDMYDRVNIYPLLLISITPAILAVFSLSFIPLRYNLIGAGLALTFKAFGWNDGQTILFSLILVCLLTFVSGNILLLCQIMRSSKVPIRFIRQ